MGVVSMYLPPGRQEQVLGLLETVEAPPGADTEVWAGDVNCQVLEPRVGEEGVAERVRSLMGGRGLSVLRSGVTHSGRAGESRIDMVAVSAASAWRWGMQTAWRRQLSDHAGLVATVGNHAVSGQLVMTPAAFKALEPAALVDLRSRFRCLERAFGVPAVDLGELRPVERREAPAVGELPAGHPAVLAAGGGGAAAEGMEDSSGVRGQCPWA